MIVMEKEMETSSRLVRARVLSPLHVVFCAVNTEALLGMNPWEEGDLATFVFLSMGLFCNPASGVPSWQQCPVHPGGRDKEEDCSGCSGQLGQLLLSPFPSSGEP